MPPFQSRSLPTAHAVSKLDSACHKRQWQKSKTVDAHPLVGRRVAVPQRFTEVEDDGDGFCFGAIVLSVVNAKRAILKFDYTCEREAFSLPLVRSWLCDAGVDPLCDALSSL